MRSKTIRNSMLLFLTACIWGLAFVSQSKGMEAMGPYTFNGVRCLLGAAAVFPLVLVQIHKEKEAGKTEKGEEQGETIGGKNGWHTILTGGLFCGLAYTAGTTLQQIGILHTTVGKAGFITTLYIIFVPILGIFLKRRVSGVVWIGAAMAALGLYLLCMEESFSLTTGDTFIMLCALAFAVHIMIIDYYSPKTAGVYLSCIQLFVCGVISLVLAFSLEAPSFSQLKEGMVSLLYAGIMSCGVGYTLQIIGQKGMHPAVASLILSMESVIATVSAFLAYKVGFLKTDQSMTGRQIIGCAIVLAAVLLVQMPVKTKSE